MSAFLAFWEAEVRRIAARPGKTLMRPHLNNNNNKKLGKVAHTCHSTATEET
jgi:hypothetical protein